MSTILSEPMLADWVLQDSITLVTDFVAVNLDVPVNFGADLLVDWQRPTPDHTDSGLANCGASHQTYAVHEMYMGIRRLRVIS